MLVFGLVSLCFKVIKYPGPAVTGWMISVVKASFVVRSYEYEDWPRGRIVFDRSRDLFILYADRKLLTLATIARVRNPISFAAGTHRGPKRLALSEHRDAERASDMIHAPLLAADLY